MPVSMPLAIAVVAFSSSVSALEVPAIEGKHTDVTSRALEALKTYGILIDGEGVEDGLNPKSCCKYSKKPQLARYSFSLPSAKGMTVLARAASARCLKALKLTSAHGVI